MEKIKLKYIILILFANSLITLILPLASALISKYLNKRYEIGFFNLTAIYSLILTLVIIFAIKLVSNKNYSSFGFKSINKKDLKITFYFFAFLFPIPLLGRLLDPSFDNWFASLYNLGSFLSILYFLVNLPLFTIKEELIERSLIQNYLSNHYNSFITILAISINFAILHFFLIPNTLYHSFVTVLSVFLGSLIISSLYYLTKNVFLTILLHALYNIVVFLQIILHINNNLIGETILFIIWGILFLMSFSKVMKEIRPLFIAKKEKLRIFDYTFLIFFTIVFPIILLIASRYL